MRKFIISLSFLGLETTASSKSECKRLSKDIATGPVVSVCGSPERIVVGEPCHFGFTDEKATENIKKLTTIPPIQCSALSDPISSDIKNKPEAEVQMVWKKNKPSLHVSCSVKGPGIFKSKIDGGNVEQEVVFEANKGNDATVQVDNTIFASLIVPRAETSTASFDFLANVWNWMSSFTSENPKQIVSVTGDDVPHKLPRFEFYTNTARDLCANKILLEKAWLEKVNAAHVERQDSLRSQPSSLQVV